jgi:hypothetical protein
MGIGGNGGSALCSALQPPWPRAELGLAREIDKQGAPTEGKGREGSAGAHLASGRLRNLSLLQIDEGNELGIGKNEEARARLINCSWSGDGGRMEQGCSRGHGLFLNRGRKAMLHRKKSRRLLCAWTHAQYERGLLARYSG